MKKLTTYEFIEKAIFVHGDKYDYSKTNYINNRTVVDIICKIHGLFQQKGDNHLAGQNCPICMGRGKSNNERFINAAKQKHGDRYDYSLVEYVNNNIKIKIKCNEHDVFEQRPKRHLSGDGCPKCNGGVKSNYDEFINKANIVHDNKYDYSLVNYINSITKVKIICKKHGVFEMKPNHHLLGQGCNICAIENKTLTTTQFIKKAQKVHGNIYDYSLVDYIHGSKKIKIICREHGVFEQTPSCHLNSRGCSKCKIKSKGELFIADWLNQNAVSFEVQKSFIDCKNVLPLRYDFYLPKYNTLIEYDGEPHFREVAYLGGKIGFELRQTNDKIKTDYATNNNIKLLRIQYFERKNLPNILKNNIVSI
jgi:hypothetical protein